ncbi:MAG: hypothetical protein ABF489_06710 [Bifidobacterium sp.]|uniref:DUF4097 family beta strand repeat-containing protein n=1 Tax=Bifidobacterium sp. TaxID=41200 RepID=UPI0039EB8D0F
MMDMDDSQREQWVVEPGQSKTFDFEDLDSVIIELVCGRVDVIGNDSPRARLEIANVRSESVDIRLDGGKLSISHPSVRGRWNVHLFGKSWFREYGHINADVSLLVPRKVALRLAAVRGDTLVSGLSHGAKIETVSGTVLSDGLSGHLHLDNVSGKVEARNHHGSVDANTVSGDVVLSADCERVKVDSVSGDLYLDAFGAPTSIDFNSVSGNASIRLASQVRLRCDVNSISGRVQVGGQTYKTSMSKGFKYEDGPYDGSPLSVRMGSVSGKLRVVRREDDEPVRGEKVGEHQ